MKRVYLYKDELRDLTHDHDYEGMMMNDTLRYDDEHGLWEMCKEVEPEQGVERPGRPEKPF